MSSERNEQVAGGDVPPLHESYGQTNVLEQRLGDSLASLFTSLEQAHEQAIVSLEGNLVLTKNEAPIIDEPEINAVIVPENVLKTTGLNMGKLARWRERLDQSLDAQPVQYEIIDPTITHDGEPFVVMRMEFDGTHYKLTRWGTPFTVLSQNDVAVEALSYDGFHVWDYHAEKRRQRRAEAEAVGVHVQEQIMELRDANDERLADILCSLADLRYTYYSAFARLELEKKGQANGEITSQDIIHHNCAHALRSLPESLQQSIADISNPTQKTLTLFELKMQMVNAANEALIEGADEAAQDQAAILAITDWLPQKIAQTDDLANWEVSRVRSYLLALLDSNMGAFQSEYEQYYDGHAFKHGRFGAGRIAKVPYPELLPDRHYASLEEVTAMVEHPPDDALIEALRSVMRLGEDAQLAGQEGDVDRQKFLEEQITAELSEIEEKYDDYFGTLNAATTAAEERLASELPFITPLDTAQGLAKSIAVAQSVERVVKNAIFWSRLLYIENVVDDIYEYFIRSDEERAEDERNNIVFLNNFRLYIVFDGQPELAEGIPNQYHYGHLPYAEIIDAYKAANQNKWEAAREASENLTAEMNELMALLKQGGQEEFEERSVVYERLRITTSKLFTDIFFDLAPQIVRAGYDPVVLTK